MKKSRFIIACLVLLGCGQSTLTPEAKVAEAVCDAFCAKCSEVDTCPDTCFGQWSIFSGGPKVECSEVYLAGTVCQLEHECGDPACGDPYLDMRRCAANIDTEDTD